MQQIVLTWIREATLCVLIAIGSVGCSSHVGTIPERSSQQLVHVTTPLADDLTTPTERVGSMTLSSYGADRAASSLAPTVGIIVDQGWTVVDIESESAASNVGVERGDVLMKLGDVVLTPLSATSAVLPQLHVQLAAAPVIKLIARRQGHTMTFNVQLARRVGHVGQPTPTAVASLQLYF